MSQLAGGVLVVDDDRAIAEIVRHALADEGYPVGVARDGEEAIERIEADRPALVVLDLTLPRLDGFGVLDRLRQRGDRAAVIVLSGRTDAEDIARAVEKGASDFVTKPFDLDELVLRVRMRLRASDPGRSPSSSTLEASPTQRALEIFTLGGLRVVIDGRTVLDENSRHRAAKQLFKYLFARRGQRLAKERIIELLWPHGEVQSGVNNLRVTVHALRQALSDTDTPSAELARRLVDQNHGFYYFNSEASYWSDVDALRGHLREARAAQARNDTVRAVAEHAAAVDLYRGPYFAEDTFDTLFTGEREELHEQFFAACNELMDLRAGRGEYDAAVELARRMLREDPSRESSYRRLMRYLALAGRRDEALQLYHRAEQLLRAEFGVEPLPETRQLYDRIRAAAPV